MKDEDSLVIGDYIADLVVAGEMIIEIKACDWISDAHVAQMLGYLRATGLRPGMLMNFASQALQIKKLVL